MMVQSIKIFLNLIENKKLIALLIYSTGLIGKGRIC
jgi:hypothetical protein